MQSTRPSYVLKSFSALLFCLAAFSSYAQVEGSWEGKLQASGVSLRIVFNITTAADGSLKATMDSPDQGAFGIAAEGLALVGDTLKLQIKAIGADYEGTVKDQGRSIEGYWTQAGVPLPLNLAPKATVALKRPQEPVTPYPYTEEQVTYKNEKAGLKFAGTLTKPTSGKHFPAVLLISGSGSQDRNSELMGHKPFLVLADYLTRQGIAVLRVDDRGVGGSERGVQQPTSEDFAQDARAAVAFLKSRRDIDRKKIGLIGHSEGGIIAPMVATQSKDVAFVVLLAAPGVRGAEVLTQQSDAMQTAQGIPAAARQLNARLQQRLIDVAMESVDEAAAISAFDSYWAARTKEIAGPFVPSDQEAAMMDSLGRQLRGQLKGLMSPWMRFYLRYDPAVTLSKLKQPVLAINGSLDKQVLPTQNLPAIEAALRTGGNQRFTVKELPGLNHLFQSAKTGVLGEYREIEETLSPEALDTIGQWIAAQMGK